MVLGIDASNLGGGSLMYLAELLAHADPIAHGFSRVRVWGGRGVLDHLPDRDWLEKIHQRSLDGSFFRKSLWKLVRLDQRARHGCDVLFLPGGNPSSFHPQVAMCHNQLPFESLERVQYAFWSKTRLRLEALRQTLRVAFGRADGLIFVTHHSRRSVERVLGVSFKNAVVIPHGVNARFLNPRSLLRVLETPKDPWRLLYVSSIDRYKNHAILAEAVQRLRRQGAPLELHLAGPVRNQRAFQRLQPLLERGTETGVFYHAEVPHADMGPVYERADWFVYPSACETFGLALPEAMGHRMPIAASCLSALPEVLADSAIYFNPRSVESIEEALRTLLQQPHRRRLLAKKAFSRARQFSWDSCAQQTFAYLAEVGHKYHAERALQPN